MSKPSKRAGAPVISEKMIAAGSKVLFESSDLGPYSCRALAAEIFTEMFEQLECPVAVCPIRSKGGQTVL
jgi:hypothetical protein